MVWVALNVNDLRSHVLGFIANRVNKNATAHRTIWTRGSRLGGAGDLEFFELRNRGSQIKSQERDTRSTHERALEEGSAGEFHVHPPTALIANLHQNHENGHKNLPENIVLGLGQSQTTASGPRSCLLRLEAP